MKKQTLLALMLASISMPVFAGAGIEGHVSTLGYGLGVEFQATDSVVTRLGFNKWDRNFTTTSGSLNLDGKLKLSSADLLFDWHLFSGATHLTVGMLSNSNKIAVTAVPGAGGTYTINGTTYTSAQIGTLSGEVTFNKTAPYLGFGWSSQPKNKGFMFSSDFGIMFQGSPKAKLSYTGTQNATISNQVAAEEANLNSKLSSYKRYPVISFAIGYAF